MEFFLPTSGALSRFFRFAGFGEEAPGGGAGFVRYGCPCQHAGDLLHARIIGQQFDLRAIARARDAKMALRATNPPT